jgi:multiple sugar transport system substrate-binding protein
MFSGSWAAAHRDARVGARHRMWGRHARTVLLVSAVLLVSSCTPSGRREKADSARPDLQEDGGASRSGRPTGPTVRVLGRDSRPLQALERIKNRHESRLAVRIEISKRDQLKQVIAELEQEPASGQSPYDLVIIPHRFLGQLVEKGHLRSIESFLADPLPADVQRFDPDQDLFKGWWRATSWYRGHPYAYPFAARTMSLWYRSDWWDEADVDAFYRKHRRPMTPSTWDGYEQIAEFQHRPDEGRYGTVIVGASDETLWYEWLQYAHGFGASILDADSPDTYGDIVVNSPEAVRATELYVRLLRFSPPDSSKYSMEDALHAFQDGRIAMAVMWHDLASRVDDRTQSKVALRIGYDPVPTADGPRATLLETDVLVIPERAQHPREAFGVMRWALSHEIQLAYTLDGGFSPRPSVYEDRSVKQHLLLHMWSYPRLIASIVPVPTIPETDQIATLMSSELSRVVAGNARPKAALDRIAVALQHLLKNKAKLRFPPD